MSKPQQPADAGWSFMAKLGSGLFATLVAPLLVAIIMRGFDPRPAPAPVPSPAPAPTTPTQPPPAAVATPTARAAVSPAATASPPATPVQAVASVPAAIPTPVANRPTPPPSAPANVQASLTTAPPKAEITTTTSPNPTTPRHPMRKAANHSPGSTAIASTAGSSAATPGKLHSRSLREAFPAAKLVPLFDGKSLAGWSSEGAKHWSVAGGVLKGRLGPNAADSRDFLYTTTSYRNFLLTARFRCTSGDAGILLRAKPDSFIAMHLFIGKVNPGALALMPEGALKAGIRKLQMVFDDSAAEKLFSSTRWNDIVVAANRDRIRCEVNGQPAFDTQVPNGPAAGVISLKLKPGAEIEFKEIKIARLGKAD